MMAMEGTIFTFSVIHTAAIDFADKVPFAVAVIEARDGERRMAFLEGYEPSVTLEIGMPVKCVRYDDAGNPIYAIKES
jgi:uncharacterized OB-fold protein